MRSNVLLALVAGLSGCATIVNGTSQKVAINTNPAAANCDIMRDTEKLGSVGSTPGEATIRRSKHDISIVCRKDGYQETTFVDHSGVAPGTYGNLALGGLVGWGVDSASGSDNQYDSPVNITLLPITPAAAAQPAAMTPLAQAKPTS